MSSSASKYRKTTDGTTPAAVQVVQRSRIQHNNQSYTIKKMFSRASESSGGLVINKIPAIIKPAVKRIATATIDNTPKTSKYTSQAIGSGGSSQWSGGTAIDVSSNPQRRTNQSLGAVISSLPPNTIIKTTGGNTSNTTASYLRSNTTSGLTVTPTTLNTLSTQNTSSTTSNSNNSSSSARRPTILIKREISKRTARSVVVELIEKNPKVHIGIEPTCLPILKNMICPTANINLNDFYLTMKKLRQNDDFAILADYFELSETEAQKAFAHTLVKLARYLRAFIHWPEGTRSSDNLKKLPFAYRHNLAHVQSLLGTVDTDILLRAPNFDCHSYKFILSVAPTGIINYISEAFLGKMDDVAILAASNFKSCVPSHLTLMVDPGKGIPVENSGSTADTAKSKPSSKKRSVKIETITGDVDGNSADSKDSITDSADESADDDEDNNNNRDGTTNATTAALENRPLSKYASTRIRGALAADQTLRIVDGELKSQKVKDFSIPRHERLRTSDSNLCRDAMRQTINMLREFNILKPCAIRETMLYQYLNEMLVVAAAITNFNRK